MRKIISLIGIILCFVTVFSVGSELLNGLIFSKWLWLAFISIPISIFTAIFLIFKPAKIILSKTDLFALIFSIWIFVKSNLTSQFYLQFLLIIFIWIFIRVMFNEKKQIDQILFVYLLFVGVQCVYGLLQLYGLLPSHHSQFLITGSFHNPGPYSGFIVSGLPIALGLFLHTRYKKQLLQEGKQIDSNSNLLGCKFFNLSFKLIDINIIFYYFSIIILVLLFLVLPSTRSRAAWIGGIAGCIFILFSYYYNRISFKQWIKRKFHGWSKFQKALLCVVGFIIIFFSIIGLYKFKQGSADGRLLMWQVSWEMIKDKPVLGWGSGGFQAQYGNYQANWFRNGNGTDSQELVAGLPDSPFNEPLRIAVEYGFIGLFLFLCIIYCLIFNSGLKNRRLQLLKSGLITILIFSFFSYPFDNAPIVLQIIILSALITNIKITSKKISLLNINNVKPLLIRTFVILVIFLIIPVLSKSTWKSYKGHQYWNRAYYQYQHKRYIDALDDYQKSIYFLPENGLLLQMYGKCLAINKNWEKANHILVKASTMRSDPILYTALGDSYKGLKEYKKAEDAYLQSWYMEPGKFYPKYLLAKLYYETGQKKKAGKIASELIKKKVKVESTTINKIKKEMHDIIEEGF